MGEAESRLVTGEDYEASIQRLTDMGFAKEDVVKAMRASFNNPERAAEYLATGMIPSIGDETPAGGAPPTESHSHSLGFLRTDPQFIQLRTIIQQNPQMIGPILEQLAQTSPELLHVIEQHREEFMGLLMEGANGEDLAEAMAAAAAGGGTSDDEMMEGGEEGVGGIEESQIIHLTDEDKAAIERLESMGFEKTMVIEAYFACDKNEELAANFLLEQLQDI